MTQTLVRNNNGLSDEQMLHACPSVFAEGAHDSRSDRYTYIPTRDIVHALRDAGFAPTSLIQSNPRNLDRIGFNKHLLRFRKLDDLDYSARAEDIHEIVLTNSHDGTSSYQIQSGVFRKVCSNGLIAFCEETSVRVKHVGNVIQNVVEGTLAIAANSEKTMGKITEMKSLALTEPERLLLAETAMAARFETNEELGRLNTIYQPADFLRPRRSYDTATDLYTTFNVIQENMIKGGITRRDPSTWERKTTRPINGIDQSVKINQLLWQLAEGMMKLKLNGVAI